MVNIKLGDKVYDGVTSVKLDTKEGESVEFSPYEETFAAGKQAEYDKFWDNFQRNGTQNLYRYAFHGFGWNNTNFVPKYDIILGTYSSGIFWCTHITDLVAALELANVRLDTSGASYLDTGFAGSTLTRVPEVSLVNAVTYSSLFANSSSLTEIQKLILKDDGSQALGEIMSGCTSLKHITIEGVIGGNSNLKSCPLTTESVQSVIDHLKDLTGSATQSITFKADVGAALTQAQKAAITAKNWTLVY